VIKATAGEERQILRKLCPGLLAYWPILG